MADEATVNRQLSDLFRESCPNIAWACERGDFSKANPVSLCMKIHNSYKSGDEDAQKFGTLIDAIEAGMAELYDTNGSLTTQLEKLKETSAAQMQQAQAQTADLTTKLSFKTEQCERKTNELSESLTSHGVMSKQVTQLASQVTKLQAALATTQTQPPQGLGHPVNHKRRSEDPDKFMGDEQSMAKRQEHYEVWRSKMGAVFAQDSAYFPTHKSRILHIGERLSGKAYDFISAGIQTIVDNPNDESPWQWKTEADLIKYLDKSYIILDPASSASQKLDNFKQGGRSYWEFYAEFCELANKAKKTDAQKVDLLLKKVSQEVSQLLTTVDPPPGADDFQGWSDKAANYATNLARHQHNAKLLQQSGTRNTTRVNTSNDNNSTAQVGGGDPMDVDAVEMRRLGIPDDEWQRRKNSGACLACGQFGHVKADHHGPNALPMPPLTDNRGGQGGTRGRGRGRGSPMPSGSLNLFGQPHDPARGRGRGRGRGRYMGYSRGGGYMANEGGYSYNQSGYTPADWQPPFYANNPYLDTQSQPPYYANNRYHGPQFHQPQLRAANLEAGHVIGECSTDSGNETPPGTYQNSVSGQSVKETPLD